MTARVGIFRAPPELRAFSMERYADGLATTLGNGFDLHDVRLGPPSRTIRALRRLPLGRRASTHARAFLSYPTAARRTRYDLNHVIDHAYAHLVFALDARRTVVTCHDIFPLHLWRGEIPGLPRRRFPPVTVLLAFSGLRRAAAVITPSRATRDDLVRMAGIAPERVHVIPYGVDVRFFEQQDVPPAADVLVVSTGAAYKNHRGALEVFARVLRQTHGAARLVRVGVPLSEADRAHAHALGLLPAVVELGNVEPDAMPEVYARSSVLLFPSLYEGFGWPPLEAMATGLPVVCSRWRSLAEVAGDAALTADAEDYDALAAHVHALLADPGYARSVGERGRARARTFTWGVAAERTAAVYDTILAAA